MTNTHSPSKSNEKMSSKKPKLTKNRHTMKTCTKKNIHESLSQGHGRTACIGCLGTKTHDDEDICVMNSMHKELFEHLNQQDYTIEGIMKKVTPREYRFKAYKYCFNSIHGRLGWQNRCPLPICVENYIKTWFAERKFPYNFCGFEEVE
jgi:hypothetical protein